MQIHIYKEMKIHEQVFWSSPLPSVPLFSSDSFSHWHRAAMQYGHSSHLHSLKKIMCSWCIVLYTPEIRDWGQHWIWRVQHSIWESAFENPKVHVKTQGIWTNAPLSALDPEERCIWGQEFYSFHIREHTSYCKRSFQKRLGD